VFETDLGLIFLIEFFSCGGELPTFDENPARPLPDWTHVHRELKRRGVTLLLLWEEYRAEHADGYGHSRFCDLYRRWRATISPTMRQAHGPAEKLFVG